MTPPETSSETLHAPSSGESTPQIDSPIADEPRLRIHEASETGALGERLLVFDCHEAWVHQLHYLGLPMDIVVGLGGRSKAGWDEAMRPVPPNSRLLRPVDLDPAREAYRCMIAHNLTDLLDMKSLAGPRLLVLHETLDGTILEQKTTIPADKLRSAVQKYTQMTGTHIVAVSEMKAKSWGLGGDVVNFCAATDEYLVWRGDLQRGLRISNHILRRPRILLWDFHQAVFRDLPVTLVGHNPEMQGVKPAADWMDLKKILSLHRFYIHTADPRFEDGYNMAMLEAMAAGLPVLGNRHPTSPIVNGVNGFVSDDPRELRGYALRLLADRDLALQLGAGARETVRRQFSPERFAAEFTLSLSTATAKWKTPRQP
jgi:hypothetical protein